MSALAHAHEPAPQIVIQLNLSGPLSPTLEAAVLTLMEATTSVRHSGVGPGGHVFQVRPEEFHEGVDDLSKPAPDIWSDEEIEQLQSLRIARVSNREIALKLDRSIAAIADMIERLRADGKLWPMPQPVAPAEQRATVPTEASVVAAPAPVPPKTAPEKKPPTTPPMASGPWSQHEKDMLIRMHADGLSNAEMGKQLGRSTAAVQVMVYNLRGLKLLPPAAERSRKAKVGEPAQPAPSADIVTDAERARNLLAMSERALKASGGIKVLPKQTPEEADAEVQAAVDYLNQRRDYSVFNRGRDKWLVNGARTYTDAEILRRARNHGFQS